MSLPKQLRDTFTPKEISFLAEQEPIMILPRYSMHGTTLISAKLPNLRALHRESIPIWLALILKRQDKCNIVIPDWLQLSYLQQKYEDEIQNPNKFSKLPWHWITISKLLLDSAVDDFMDPVYEIRSLIQDLREVRLLKARRGLKELNEVYLQLDGLSLIEINEVRPFVLKVMNQLRKLKESSKIGEQEMYGDDTEIGGDTVMSQDVDDDYAGVQINDSVGINHGSNSAGRSGAGNSYLNDSHTRVQGDSMEDDDSDSDDDIYRKD
ncbi:unnamed protein product [Ambrosiozyma monospora]|uniref:DNA replication complex GINS protein PSF2 n=1 Tax=Ambrosiozyma monospora TaxID=43982 RepID=A0A9W6YY72_AMBMO|nr:unnamed protein product [Ambrosiozyma monospora]